MSAKNSVWGRLGTVAVWSVTVVESVLMGLAGSAKFVDTETWTGMFEGWGYPAWLALVTGASELGLALTILVPRLASYAAMGLIAIMLGALTTVLLHPGGRMGPTPPVLHLVLLAVILVARWRARWTPRSQREHRHRHGIG